MGPRRRTRERRVSGLGFEAEGSGLGERTGRVLGASEGWTSRERCLPSRTRLRRQGGTRVRGQGRERVRSSFLAPFRSLTPFHSGGRPIRTLRPSVQAPRRLPRRLGSRFPNPLLLLLGLFALPPSSPLLPLDHFLPSLNHVPNFPNHLSLSLKPTSHPSYPNPFSSRWSAPYVLFARTRKELEGGVTG